LTWLLWRGPGDLADGWPPAGVGDRRYAANQADVYPRVDDEATIVLTYPHAQAIVQASWNWPFSRKDMEVYGQRGYAITVGRDAVRVRLPEKQEISADAKPLEKTKEDFRFLSASVLLGGLKPEGQSSLETNVIVTEILDAARQSAATGKTVSSWEHGRAIVMPRIYFTGTGRSSDSRTFCVSTCGVNGFWRKEIPSSSVPSCAITL